MDLKDVAEQLPQPISDPAEYLFETTELHDCHITVGDPDSEEVETIGVSRGHLVSHSSVFRGMLKDSGLADPSGRNTHITDISPAVFKLMLRYMYGGGLPLIPRDTAASLLLGADKYNIQPLVKQSTVLLLPTSVDELFPALVCVTYVSLPTLLPHVTKLLQEQTDQVVSNKQFLQLDANCVELIAKQDTLAITELELWFSLVSWAKAKVKDPTEQRRLLAKPLQHVRLLTLTQDQIVKEVMNSEILSPAELIALLSAITNHKALKEPGLCSFEEIRKTYSKMCSLPEVKNKFNIGNSYKPLDYLTQQQEYQSFSNFTIQTFDREVWLKSFFIQARSFADENNRSDYCCKFSIKVYKSDRSGIIEDTVCIEDEGQVSCGQLLHISLGSLILAPNSEYNFFMTLFKSHPVFKSHKVLLAYDKMTRDTTFSTKTIGSYLSLTCNTPFHIKKLNYGIASYIFI